MLGAAVVGPTRTLASETVAPHQPFSASKPSGMVHRVDQAFWQLFHAVEDRLSEIDPTDLKTDAPRTNGAVAVDLNGPPHALGVLRRKIR